MKRWVSLLIILAMMVTLAACGNGADEQASPSAAVSASLEQAQDKPDQTPSSAEPDHPVEQAVPAERPQQSGPNPLQVRLGRHEESEWTEDYTLLSSVEWQSIVLGEESAKAFPTLAASLQQMNVENYENNLRILNEMLPEAKTAAAETEYFNGFTSTSEYVVQRADEHILSVRVNESEYTGSAHPMYWVLGINLDPASGARIPLTDVLTDTESLTEILAQKIREKFPFEPFTSLEEMLGEYAPEQFTWTLGYQGITFYFSPYEIASYAAGLLTATIWFDEYPELFVERYTQVPLGGYAIVLSDYDAVEIDLKPGDGKRDVLALSIYGDEYGDLQVAASLNDGEYALEDCRGYEMIPQLVCLRDGGTNRFFLYIEATAENDFTTIYVYDLNSDGITPGSALYGAGFTGVWDEDVGEYGTWYEDVFNNPSEFVLSSIIERLGTWVGTRTYTTNPKDGSIVPQMDYYELPDTVMPIVSYVPLEVTMLPGKTKETLPAGTNFYFRRTDVDTYADMELEDGRQCRIAILYDGDTPMINGVPEWDCFEELLYSG